MKILCPGRKSDGATLDVSGDGSSDKESADTTAAGNVTSGLGSLHLTSL